MKSMKYNSDPNYEAVLAELEADNKRLEKENNLLRDTVEPRTEQLIAMAAKNKALRKACIRLICSKRYGVMRDQVVIAEDEFELFEKALQEQGEENE